MDARVIEFQCIMPMANIPSVLKHGILSNERAAKLKHYSVAMQEMQDKRDTKQVPGGLKLHQYANLYFHARNPMLYKRKDEAGALCVLRVKLGVLKSAGVVITDRNAASDYVRFLAPSQVDLLDFDDIYAADWRHPNNPFAFYAHKSRKCAEVLVPHCVEPGFITGAYVMDKAAAGKLTATGFDLAITVDSDMFFH